MSDPFQPNLLSGKVALVTGGGSGINLAIAQRMAAQGAALILVGRTLEKVEAAARDLEAAGGRAIGLSADVRDYAALEAAIVQGARHFGGLDIVVCGAAGNFPAPATGMSANGFRSVVDIDLLGTFNTCRAAFEYLRKPGASVVAISAVQALMPTALQSHVSAAKAGVDMLIRTLALEWGPLGVRLNSIAPGPVEDTEGVRRLVPTEAAREALTRSIPLQRFAQGSEIADLALFLCSDAARYITGAVIPCDGGQSLHGSGIMMSSLGIR
ncbi:NAD(P)-dependent dehydrogenase (short-subunit alcohol dehydrogenase family) [Deinobacterium chartae]|uniref:NAD(P)-dependent dehydrogenase (Short-subunit alcohol dehydrogenase family) n=1 Tax=Deinobacterium chartae TaxID=521158 RepID=A0A841I457_9DEIO|nr:SDR family oxidoreductase [Deinobacterium chartae]MBB6098782.1 NAD(P)-dependent dehydrogenase (short-subunit alcohol dehydrogenase family) [Deinobacterium chartae]